jgi:hypothetical protein
MYPNAHTDMLAEMVARAGRRNKPTVRLRRPSCTELAERPDLVAQLVLDVSAL